MSSAMLHKSYFVSCFLCFILLCVSLPDPVLCAQAFYKLVGKDGDTSVDDKNVPFLTSSFFSCGSNEDCIKVTKEKGNNEFKEVIGQQAVKEHAVVCEKVSTLRIDEYPTWSAWNIAECSANCGGGKRTFTRYCYSHLPCMGKGSKVENCNTEGCPELYNCKRATTRFTDGLSSTNVRTARVSWLPLVDLKPSCNSSGNNLIMTSASLERNDTDIRYNYSCCIFKTPICHMMLNSTNWSNGHDGVNLAISKHPIDCGEFGFISSFQLQRNSATIRYSYACWEIVDLKWKDLMQCKNVTRHVVINGFHTLTLAEIPVSCDAGFGLSRLTLQMNPDKRQWGFEFRCCSVAY